MLPSRKINMAITGLALVALGIICMINPAATVSSLTWLVGVLALVSGACTLLNWMAVRHFIYRSGNLFLSAVAQILLGILFLKNNIFVTGFLPLLFALFLISEGINLSIRALDYKAIGFRPWWINFVLGIGAAILGFSSLLTPGVGGSALSIFIGIGFLAIGVVYLIALWGVSRFEKRLNDNPWIDVQ